MSSPGAGSADAADAQAVRDAAWDMVKTALQSGVVRAAVATSVGGTALGLPTPLIYVQGRVGPIPLPVDADTAAALMALPACAPAPCGRVTETACHQMDASAVTIRGRGTEWVPGIGALVEHVCKSFELPAKALVALPYKLQLHGPGGHFKAHRDTEKADRMFGTLIVQFPSNHAGGALVVRHGGSEVVHSFGAPAAGSTADSGASAASLHCHFAAHYACMEHELTEVTRGYRLTMVYLLSYTGEAASTPTVFAGTARLAARLAAPLEVAMRPPAVLSTDDLRFECDAGFKLIRLSHDYTLQSLRESGAAALKDRDAVLCAVLRRAAAKKPFALLLASIQGIVRAIADVGDDAATNSEIEADDDKPEPYTEEFVDYLADYGSARYEGHLNAQLCDASGTQITCAREKAAAGAMRVKVDKTLAQTPCAPCMLTHTLFCIRPPGTLPGELDEEEEWCTELRGFDHVCRDYGVSWEDTPPTILPLFGNDFWSPRSVDARRACKMDGARPSYDIVYNATAIVLIANEHPQFASMKEALVKAAALSLDASPASTPQRADGGGGTSAEGGSGRTSTAAGGAGAAGAGDS